MKINNMRHKKTNIYYQIDMVREVVTKDTFFNILTVYFSGREKDIN